MVGSLPAVGSPVQQQTPAVPQTGATTLAPFLAPIGPMDLASERAELGAALDEAVLRVVQSGQYILGPEVLAFEKEFARFQGAAEGIGVANGTDALVLCLKACCIGPGDEVITTPFSFFASAGAIAWVGATPRLVDVERGSALISVPAIEAAITPRTRAIVAVHLYGQLCDLKALRALCDRRKLFLIEDAAQAHGAERASVRAGQLGDLTAFSFYPTKNLGALGDAGMVLTRDADTAVRVRRLRDHGSPAKYVHQEIGTNSRLDAVQAAALRIKLPHLERWNHRRRELAARYAQAFAGHPGLVAPDTLPGSLPCWHQYSLRFKGGAAVRDHVKHELQTRGVTASIHYPTPIHLQPVAAALWNMRPGEHPEAEAWASEVLCLPIHPFLTPAQVDRIAEAILHLTPRG